MASSQDNSTELSGMYETQLTRRIKFGLFVALEPPALICNIILIYYLIADRTLRRTLHHHAVLALLFVTLLTNLEDTPRIIDYLRFGVVLPQTNINCSIWQWLDCSFYAAVAVYMMCISLERYLLIFHDGLYRSSKRRLWFHYVPLVSIMIYILLFYAIAIFAYPCESQLDFTQPFCGGACYAAETIISLYDLIAHAALPILLGMLIDVTLVIRVLFRKRVGQQHQIARYRKHRKMMIQLLTISTFYLTCEVPYTVILYTQFFISLPDWLNYIQVIYFYYSFWLLSLLLPFTCIACITDVTKKLKNVFMQRRRRVITPIPMVTLRSSNRTKVS